MWFSQTRKKDVSMWLKVATLGLSPKLTVAHMVKTLSTFNETWTSVAVFITFQLKSPPESLHPSYTSELIYLISLNIMLSIWYFDAVLE
jgi:hypothetical protein